MDIDLPMLRMPSRGDQRSPRLEGSIAVGLKLDLEEWRRPRC